MAVQARKLERSNRDLDQFAFVASHDLKAPLRGIASLCTWIEEDAGAALVGESRDHLRLMRSRIARLESLIDGILAYSRAGRVGDGEVRFELGQLAREVVDLLALTPEQQVRLAPDLPVLRGNRASMQQILTNLVGNALKHGADEATQVEVRAQRVDGAWQISVSDNGSGIAPEFHERVFGIFQTLVSRDTVESTGIGLAVVKKLVDGHGGRVWIESTPEVAPGCTFHFTWPDQSPGVTQATVTAPQAAVRV
jgi:light-regulated signal transduction histidine kinase (bacteriophytochrome)